jgi:hypothetical protein
MVLQSRDFPSYAAKCKMITSDFVAISSSINSVEAVLRKGEREGRVVADIIRGIQGKEKEKLATVRASVAVTVTVTVIMIWMGITEILHRSDDSLYCRRVFLSHLLSAAHVLLTMDLI